MSQLSSANAALPNTEMPAEPDPPYMVAHGRTGASSDPSQPPVSEPNPITQRLSDSSTSLRLSSQNAATGLPNKTGIPCLLIATTTWARDSHELFDYEAQRVHKRSYFVKRPFKVFRTSLDVQVLPDGHPPPNEAADYLLSVRQREGRYIVTPPEKMSSSGLSSLGVPKRVWLIVNQLPQGHHQLQESDIIKLGRFRLRVKQLVKRGHSPLAELRLDDVEMPHSNITAAESTSLQCRICLLDGGTVEDPLLCPCQCKGSIKFIHLECLKHWINGRLLLTEDSRSKSFFFKHVQCELCKTPFPSAMIVNGERVPIIEIPRIEAPFIVLENLGGVNRGLHVVSMEERKELKLGRGHESDIRIADVSISRYHATIRFADGECTLEDHHSKFGTLVSLRKFQTVEPTHPVVLQVGRTVLNLSLATPPSDFDDILRTVDDPGVSTPESDHDDHDLTRDNLLSDISGNDSSVNAVPPQVPPQNHQPQQQQSAAQECCRQYAHYRSPHFHQHPMLPHDPDVPDQNPSDFPIVREGYCERLEHCTSWHKPSSV